MDMQVADLETTFAEYVVEARRLQKEFEDQISILVGMETELCRPESVQDIQRVRDQYQLDYVVCSVHHVNGIPIDFSSELFEKAEAQFGSTEALFVAYFKALEVQISETSPEIVGHVDLIKLFRPDFQFTPAVWDAVERVLKAGVACGALFEINTAGLRKNLGEPYPGPSVLKVALPTLIRCLMI